MSMSDCPKCWDSNCQCGYKYRDMKKEDRIKFASSILGVDPDILRGMIVNVPEKHPQQE